MSKTISLALIVRNEADMIERCIKSFEGGVDEVVVCDTGSTDDTVKIAESLGAKIVHHVWKDDFAAARQASFDECTSDFIIWADADDVLGEGCAPKLRKAAECDLADVFMMPWFIEMFHVEQSPFERERLIRRGCGHWERAVHEEFKVNPGTRIGRTKDIFIVHRSRTGKLVNSDRNFRIIEKNCQHTTIDLFYLALGFSEKGDHEKAKSTAQAALALGEKDGMRDIERHEMLLVISDAASTYQEKIEWAAKAYCLMPFRREALIKLCHIAVEAGKAGEALGYARAFMSIPKPAAPIWTLKPPFYGWLGADLATMCLRANGLFAEAHKIDMAFRDQKNPMFSLIHASRRRPEKMVECRNLWLMRAFRPEFVEHTFALDQDDEESIRVAKAYRHVIIPPGGGCVAAWNAAAMFSTGVIMIQLSDDWIPPENWDKLLIERIGEDMNKERVIAVSDGIDRGGGEITKCMCLAIMTRARYDFQGHMFFPGYKSVYSDNEFSDRAEADGIVIDARDLVFEHQHPLAGKAEMDDTYRNQNAPNRYSEGEQVYLSRKLTKKGLDRKYAAFILAAKDDFCLWEVCYRLIEEGVESFFFGCPTEFWNGTSNTKENWDQVQFAASNVSDRGFQANMMHLNVSKHREEGRDILITEAMVRNEMLDKMRMQGWDHVLVVDSDEFWMRGTLQLFDRYISDNQPESLNCRMIPVAGLPGYPIENAIDAAMVYLGPDGRFNACRGSKGMQKMFPRRQVIHFTETRRTMDEILKKNRESGHYTDAQYDFEGWLKNVLPVILPGMKNAHMYRGENPWPLVREWTKEEWAQIPDTLKPYLGKPK
jgi:glycosyltransferase involved in cell wall biosynthesis